MRLWAALFAICAGAASAQGVSEARYLEPTDRYPHAVLGDALEWGILEMRLVGGETRRLVLPESRVFEDLAPRVADVDGDGLAEVVVVESDAAQGARLAIYDGDGLKAATPFIGTRFRWLAPFAITDLDGDGAVEIAYIDRPHLAKTLRIWRMEDGALRQVATAQSLTNHRIGEAFISGLVRDCDMGVEMVLASSNWRSVMGVRLRSGALIQRPLGPFAGPESWQAAAECRI